MIASTQVDLDGTPAAAVHGNLRLHKILVQRSATGATASSCPTSVLSAERADYCGISVNPWRVGNEKLSEVDFAATPRGMLIVAAAPMHQAE